MTDEQLIEAMARAMFKDDQTCRLEIAKAIFEVCKPTIEAPLRAENEKLLSRIQGCEKAYVRLNDDYEKLRAAMHDIYEVYAGSEGFIPQTCPEAYLQERVKEMADIAAKHKRAAALKGTGDE